VTTAKLTNVTPVGPSTLTTRGYKALSRSLQEITRVQHNKDPLEQQTHKLTMLVAQCTIWLRPPHSRATRAARARVMWACIHHPHPPARTHTKVLCEMWRASELCARACRLGDLLMATSYPHNTLHCESVWWKVHLLKYCSWKHIWGTILYFFLLYIYLTALVTLHMKMNHS